LRNGSRWRVEHARRSTLHMIERFGVDSGTRRGKVLNSHISLLN
jgi:hypothetical protein